jgi:hypothetical protein
MVEGYRYLFKSKEHAENFFSQYTLLGTWADEGLLDAQEDK